MIRKTFTRRRRTLVLVAATMLLSTACGGGDDTSAKDDETTTTTSTSTTTTTTSTTTTTTSAGGSFGTAPTPTTVPAADAVIDTNYVPEKEGMSVESGAVEINGTSYSAGLVMVPNTYGGRSARLEINAGRDFKRFRGELGIPESQPSNTAYKVEISLDNAAPALSTEVRFFETKTIDLDVTNVLRVKVVVTPISECCSKLAIGNPRFSR